MDNVFAFISRHEPTETQREIAEKEGIELVHVGDCDAFTITKEWVLKQRTEAMPYFSGVIVVHPAAALRLCEYFSVGVFENANRAEVGQPPSFEPVALHFYNI